MAPYLCRFISQYSYHLIILYWLDDESQTGNRDNRKQEMMRFRWSGRRQPGAVPRGGGKGVLSSIPGPDAELQVVTLRWRPAPGPGVGLAVQLALHKEITFLLQVEVAVSAHEAGRVAELVASLHHRTAGPVQEINTCAIKKRSNKRIRLHLTFLYAPRLIAPTTFGATLLATSFFLFLGCLHSFAIAATSNTVTRLKSLWPHFKWMRINQSQ